MLAAAVGAVAANAQSAPQTPTKAAAAASTKDSGKAAPAPPSAGVVVFIDPATGQIRQPEAAEIGTLSAPSASPQTAGGINAAAAAQRHTPDEHREFRGAGGAIGVKLGDDSLSYMVVSKTSDGKLAEDCVTGADAAAALVSKEATPKTPAAPAKPKVVLDDK
jgi:hypothetical protein